MRRVATAAIACTGCAQILGIDSTSGQTGAAPTVQLERVSVGASVSSSPLDLTLEGPPVFLVADATQPCGMRLVSAMQIAADTWSPGDVAGTPAVAYVAPDLPTPYLHHLSFDSRAQKAVFFAYEHPNPEMAPSSQLVLDVTLPTAYASGETFAVDAIGAWTRHQLSAGELPVIGGTAITSTISYSTFAATTPSPPARISAQDVVLVERYDAAGGLTGVLQISPFDQSDSSDPIDGAITALTADQPLSAAVAPSALAARFQALRPMLTGALGESWSVYATAGYAVGTFPGVTLAHGTVAATDTSISATYAMPFESLQWRPVLTYVASQSRTYTLDGAPTTLQALAYQIADPGTVMSLDFPAGLPESISINQTPLATDGATIPLDLSQTADLDILPDASGATYYQIELDSLASNGTAVTRTPVAIMYGPTTHFDMPPWFFDLNKTYTITAGAVVGGYPNATTGDLVTFALPMSVSQADSAVFTVVAK